MKILIIVMMIVIGMLAFALFYIILNALFMRRKLVKEHPELKKPSMFKNLAEDLKRGQLSVNGKRMLLILAALVCLMLLAASRFTSIFLSAVLGGAVYVVPNSLLKSRKKKFLENFNNSLVDGLEVISNAMKAGNSFGQALNVSANEIDEPMASEFKEVVKKNNMGMAFAEAMSQLGAKYPESNELRLAITSINISLEVGGNLSNILEKITSTMKQRKKIKQKIGALTAQGIMSAYVTGGTPFVMLVMMYFTQRDMTTLMFTTIEGNIMLVFVVLLDLLGISTIKKISAVEV